MNQLDRNLDLAAILVLALLLGIAQAPQSRVARMLRVAQIVDVAQERVIPRIQQRALPRIHERLVRRIQERMASCPRTRSVNRLVFSSPR